EAEAEHAEPQLVTNLAHLAQMLMHFVAGLMQSFERRSAQLELAPGLERDRTSSIVRERDRIAVLDDGFPAETSHFAQHGADPVRTVVRHPAQIRAAEDKFFVLGADSPSGRGLAAGLEILDELALVSDRRSW